MYQLPSLHKRSIKRLYGTTMRMRKRETLHSALFPKGEVRQHTALSQPLLHDHGHSDVGGQSMLIALTLDIYHTLWIKNTPWDGGGVSNTGEDEQAAQ